MRKRLIAVLVMASTVPVLIPSVADAGPERRTCIRAQRGSLNIQIGYCP
ncbi:MAG: hypothetical protein ABR518_03805 [Actinomycetota bacterium]